MVVFQILWSLQIVKWSNLGLQRQSTYPRWLIIVLCFCFIIYFPSCAILYFQWGYAIQLIFFCYHQFLYFSVQWRSTFTICKEVQDHHSSWRGMSRAFINCTYKCTNLHKNKKEYLFLVLPCIESNMKACHCYFCANQWKVDILRSYVCNYSFE